MKYILSMSLMACSLAADSHWYELKYDSPSDCFTTGAKRVFVPFPGFGTIGCVKDAMKQLPDYNKSAHLLAGHATALITSGFLTFAALVVGLNCGIPGTKQVLGPELVAYFKIKSLADRCE